MTRIRTTPTIVPGDGGAFEPSNRPPAHRVPKSFTAALAEYDNIFNRLHDVMGENGTLEQNWGALEHEAMKQDAQAAMTAAREGNTVPTGTPKLDELNKRRASLQATRAALQDARTQITNELAEIREKEQGNLDKYRAAEDKARAELVKALEPLEAALSNLAEAIALREWVEHHYPWDTNTAFDVHALWYPANQMNLNSHDRAVHLSNIVGALKNL